MSHRGLNIEGFACELGVDDQTRGLNSDIDHRICYIRALPTGVSDPSLTIECLSHPRVTIKGSPHPVPTIEGLPNSGLTIKADI